MKLSQLVEKGKSGGLGLFDDSGHLQYEKYVFGWFALSAGLDCTMHFSHPAVRRLRR